MEVNGSPCANSFSEPRFLSHNSLTFSNQTFSISYLFVPSPPSVSSSYRLYLHSPPPQLPETGSLNRPGGWKRGRIHELVEYIHLNKRMVYPPWPTEEEGNASWEEDWHGTDYKQPTSPKDGIPSTGRQPTNHLRTMTESIERPTSILPEPRRRSSTATSSEIKALGRPSLTIETGRRPYDRRSTSLGFHARNERSGSFTKTLKSKASRFLRRQDSHGNLTSLKPIDWSDELDDSPWRTGPNSPKRDTKRLQRMSRLEGKPRGHPCNAHIRLTDPFASVGSVENESPIRHNISQPFDFRHVSHANDDDFKQMQASSPHSVGVSGSDARTRRMSLAAKAELRGIRAETISRQNSPPTSSSSSRPSTPRKTSGGLTKSPTPQIPPRPEHPWGFEQQSPFHVIDANPLSHHGSPVAEPGFVPPPPTEPQSATSQEVSPPHTPVHEKQVDASDTDAFDFGVPHAVTTPDDAAHVLRPPPFEHFRTELSRVIEEDEISERRSSIATLARRSSTPDSSLRHVKSFPNPTHTSEASRQSIAETYRRSIQTSPKRQRRSFKVIQPSFDDAEGDVPNQSRYSATVRDVEGNWDDVIDWCYDHEAEADCNFDFARCVSPSPGHGPEEDATSPEPLLHSSAFALARSEKRSSSVYSASPPLLPQLRTSAVPDLEPPSAISAQSSFDGASEAQTPDTTSPNLDPRHPLFNAKPNLSKPAAGHSPHVSNDMTPPDLYESLCQENYTRDSWHYGRIEGSTISTASPRSSGSRISKSSSQESFSLRRRRSNNTSQGSLPELITSRASKDRVDSLLMPDPEHLSTLALEDTTASRRKSPASLVKDVAQKNLLTKLRDGGVIEDACSAQVPLPLHPALRNSTPEPTLNSASLAKPDLPARRSLAPAFVREDISAPTRPAAPRMRSASSATNLTQGKSSTFETSGKGVKSVNISPRASRASYGLYPLNNRRV